MIYYEHRLIQPYACLKSYCAADPRNGRKDAEKVEGNWCSFEPIEPCSGAGSFRSINYDNMEKMTPRQDANLRCKYCC